MGWLFYAMAMILIKNIYTLYSRKRFLLRVTYISTNLEYPFTPRVTGIRSKKSRIIYHVCMQYVCKSSRFLLKNLKLFNVVLHSIYTRDFLRITSLVNLGMSVCPPTMWPEERFHFGNYKSWKIEKSFFILKFFRLILLFFFQFVAKTTLTFLPSAATKINGKNHKLIYYKWSSLGTGILEYIT